jgi:hypothetical protein
MRHFYIQMERRVKGLAARETERECVRDGEWLKIGLALVVKTAVGETDQFGIIQDYDVRLYCYEKLF